MKWNFNKKINKFPTEHYLSPSSPCGLTSFLQMMCQIVCHTRLSMVSFIRCDAGFCWSWLSLSIPEVRMSLSVALISQTQTHTLELGKGPVTLSARPWPSLTSHLQPSGSRLKLWNLSCDSLDFKRILPSRSNTI